MIAIKLKNINLETLEHIVSLSKSAAKPDQGDDVEAAIGKPLEEIIEDYLSTPNTNKTVLSEFLLQLDLDEIIEMLALYYFFSKLTYDTALVPDEELYPFWELCRINAGSDIARIGLVNMIDYLKERTNLSVILSTAAINLK